jgi:hypothetical protein
VAEARKARETKAAKKPAASKSRAKGADEEKAKPAARKRKSA